MLELTPEEFSKEVEDKVATMGDGYIEAILCLCEHYQVDPTLASKYLSKSIVNKLHNEGLGLNILPQTAKLPI